ncbi:hypothetical protein GQ600_4345 [Phytophthora cactorum]|nr:hypothetical protein GQ600_4345 [Phytophthora cactorum]
MKPEGIQAWKWRYKKLMGWTDDLPIRSTDKFVTDKVARIFNEIDPNLLGPVIVKPLPFWGGLEKVENLQKYMVNQMKLLDKPFSWELPNARFPFNPEVQAVLRGPDATIKMKKGVRKLTSFQDATNYAAKRTRGDQVNASFKTTPNAAATIGDAPRGKTPPVAWSRRADTTWARSVSERFVVWGRLGVVGVLELGIGLFVVGGRGVGGEGRRSVITSEISLLHEA